MFCTNCGQRLADGAKRCPNCGEPVEGAAAEELVNEVVEVEASAPAEAGQETPVVFPVQEEIPVTAVPAEPFVSENPIPVVSASEPAAPQHNTPVEASPAGSYRYEEPKTASSYYSEPVTLSAPVSGSGRDTMALVGFILSIISLIACCLQPYVLVGAAAGLVLSILGLKSTKRRGLAIAGIVLAILAILLGIFVLVASLAMSAMMGESLEGMSSEEIQQILEQYLSELE